MLMFQWCHRFPALQTEQGFPGTGIAPWASTKGPREVSGEEGSQDRAQCDPGANQGYPLIPRAGNPSQLG